jgi:hypothetical protein
MVQGFDMNRIGRLSLAAALVAVLGSTDARAGSSWDGIWTGMLNDIEPVSVTIAKGKVVSYAIRGGQPFEIAYSKVTLKTVSFGDHDNYDVEITKTGAATAAGIAHSPMGEGSATLTRQDVKAERADAAN